MRAFTLDRFGAQPALRDDIPEPHVGDDELLVRVRTSSVNPVDVFIAAGGLKEMAAHEFPVMLGRDFAGVVEQVGPAGSLYRVGDEVLGFVRHADPAVRDGSWAELITVREDSAARKPPSLDFARAGANVIAPALPEDHDYLRGFGVSELVDRDADVATAVRASHPDGVDAILDLVSREPDASLLDHGGRLASPLGAAGEGPERFNVMAQPTPANLLRLVELLDTGALRISLQRSFELEQAGDALRALPATHTQGKLGVTIE